MAHRLLRVLLVAGCCITTAVVAAGKSSAPDSTVIAEKNPFDRERRAWPDIVPPPPPPAPISTEDIQLYGVVIAGNVKRAVVKVGGNLKHLASSNGRAYLTVSEGQALGSYIVSEIQSHQVLLSSGATRQAVVFGKKTDRPMMPMMAMQGASPPPPPAPKNPEPASATASPPSFGGAPLATAPATAPPFVAPAVPVPQATASPVQDPAATGAARPSGPQSGMSLAEAIAAAQAAAAQGNQPPTPNPFLMRK